MRLVDADWVLAHIKPYEPTDENWAVTGGTAIRLIKKAIDNAPTVDAVPVVRCKDCKHRPTKPDDYNPIYTDGFVLEFPDEECPCQCGDGWYSEYPSDDWFCPKGEREGGDE